MRSILTVQRGFSIIELMITITVLGLLLGIAVPSFTETVRNNRIISQNNELVASLNLARSEALKRSGSVSVCASADQATCSNSTNWGTGWIVFNDPNANGTLDAADGTDALLQTAGAAPPQFTLNATNRSFVRFAGSGMAPAGLEIFDLIRTGCSGLHARRINVSLVGRVSTTTVACP
jgi:type IV fimbrial biogenesis protein FimT